MKFKLGHYFRKALPVPVPPPETQHEIIVSSNCQIGGLAAALKCMFPKRDIGVQPFPKSDNPDAVKIFRDALEGARIWVTSDRFDLGTELPIEIIRIPDLNFYAFHPDMRAATNVTTNSLTTPTNNSQIAVWAYNNQIAKPDAVKLFNRSVFKSLGYLDCWSQSVDALRTRFVNRGIDTEEFERFFLRVKRIGQFMYTFNHPRIEALIELARIVARRLGANSELAEREVVIPDALTFALWPLYPEVGEELGLRGSYHWRFSDTHSIFDLYGIEAYLDFAYQSYAKQGIRPMEVQCRSPTPNLDNVLREQVSSQ
jgi:hypothetical protein